MSRHLQPAESPIREDDAFIEDVLKRANLPALLMSMLHITGDETITSVDSPIADGGTLYFTDSSGDPLGMRAYDPDWWEYEHGNIYVTDAHWVELVMPENSRAFSFWVGASFSGRAWGPGLRWRDLFD